MSDKEKRLSQVTSIKFVLVVFLLAVSGYPALAQQRSAKRGIAWDEKTQALSDATVLTMAPGVAWVYNWGVAPRNEVQALGPATSVDFVPLCWNDNFDEAALRSYLDSHPGGKVLLGFNEPNFSAQAGMTPQQAAAAWPRLEQLAAEYHLELVAPALNFTSEVVGGRAWSPYEWLDEFFRLYPTAQVDYLALHCYMNWYSSTAWFATEYFYKDLYDATKADVYGRYPCLVKYLNGYKEAKGHFPQMYLTEFCAWEGNKDGFTLTADSQIDQMTQKVQLLERSDLVAGYAWFLGNAEGGAAAYPYNSVFQQNSTDSELSTLGKVYVAMSSFDAEKYYALGETILAKDYINAGTGNAAPRIRPNTEPYSDIPLQVEWNGGAWVAYQVDIPSHADYHLTLHIQSAQAAGFRIYRNATGGANKLADTTPLPATSGEWADVTIPITLPAGRYALLLYNVSTSTVLLNSLSLQTTTGISTLHRQPLSPSASVYDLCGRKLSASDLCGHKHSAAHTPCGIGISQGRKVVLNNN